MSRKKKKRNQQDSPVQNPLAMVPPAMRMKAMGYSDAGASRTRRALRGMNAVSGSAQQDIDLNNYTLRQRSRMLYMAAPLATSAVDTNRTKVVGTGLTLKTSVNRTFLNLEPETA